MLHARLDDEQTVKSADPFVYVIDDEADLRESSCFLLAALGLNCVQYPSGTAFLEDVADLEPGCILLDVVMRNMGGLEVQAELRGRGINWPVVFMSGHQDVPTVVSAVQSGAIEFLAKPFTDEALLAALHRGFIKLRSVKG
jgi:two-component system response regulator FixJ